MRIRKLSSRKVLVASMGVATMSYVMACGGTSEPTGNDGGPEKDHATVDEFPLGNLVARPDTGAQDGTTNDTIDEFPLGNLVAQPDTGVKDATVHDTLDEFPLGNLVVSPDSGKKD